MSSIACAGRTPSENISDIDFGRAMAGDAIDSATTALLEELTDFSRKPSAGC